MSLKSWLDNHWIVSHETSADEIGKLLSVVDRDLTDAAVQGISSDLKGNLAYDAARQLALVGLHAEGYRPGRERPHERAINSLKHTIGASNQTVEFLDLARRKRNSAQYGEAGGTSSREAAEMLAVVATLRKKVVAWMKQKHPELLIP